ncbi:MAG: hypothetical protein H6713_01785 [Myxococcales bacterium]|nr:hypothetical protein [Myxococcales bacterium]
MRSSWYARAVSWARPGLGLGLAVTCALATPGCKTGPARGESRVADDRDATPTAAQPQPPGERAPEEDPWEDVRARADMRVVINDPERLAAALDRVTSLYGSSSGERDGVMGRLRELSIELGIPGPLIDGVDPHGSLRVSTVYPWRPPAPSASATPGSELAIVIPSPDPRALAETTAALNLMQGARDGAAPSSEWVPTERSLLPIFLREASGHVELSSSRAGLADARALAEQARAGQGLWLELDGLAAIAPELARALGYNLHEPARARALAVAERLDSARASLTIDREQDLVAELSLRGRFAELDRELDGLMALLGPPRVAPTRLEGRLPGAPAAAAIISLADPQLVQRALADVVEAPGERPVFDEELRELGRELNELLDQLVDDVALGVYVYGAGEHAFVLAATVRDPTRARASLATLLRESADLASRYSGFFNALTGAARPDDKLDVSSRPRKHGSLRAQHVAIALPPTLVPEERGSYLTFGPDGVLEYSALVERDILYVAIGPGTASFLDAVAALARAREDAPRGSLAASAGAQLVHAAPGGCQVCVVFDSGATTRSLIGRGAQDMSRETIAEAERLLPTLGAAGQGGWARRLRRARSSSAASGRPARARGRRPRPRPGRASCSWSGARAAGSSRRGAGRSARRGA